MDDNDFIGTTFSSFKGLISDGELSVTGYVWLLKEDGVDMMALDLEPRQCWELFITKCSELGTKKAIFVLDRYGAEEQGTTMDSVLTGIIYYGTDKFQSFIMEYNQQGETLPVNYENEFWNDRQKFEMKMTMLDIIAVEEQGSPQGSA